MEGAGVNREARRAIINLSSEQSYQLQIPGEGGDKHCTITRQDLETALKGSSDEKDLLEAARHQIMAAINDANWRPQDVERIVLIGGPTQLPCIRKVLDVVFHSNQTVLQQIESF